MRKEMNSKSKRKFFAGVLAAFASVALLTTGFATWVVGTSKTSSEQGGLKVNVDTAKNASIELIATLSDSDNSVNFAEESKFGSDKFVQSTATDGDLDITFSELKIVYGTESGFDPTRSTCQLQFTLLQINGVDAARKNTVVYSSSTDLFHRDGSKTYIEAPEAVNLNNLSVGSASDSESGTKTYTFTQKTFSFRWGSAFENKSPCTYYNEKFDAGEGAPEKNATNANFVYNELTEMKTKLNPDTTGSNPGSLKLRIDVVGYTASSGGTL